MLIKSASLGGIGSLTFLPLENMHEFQVREEKTVKFNKDMRKRNLSQTGRSSKFSLLTLLLAWAYSIRWALTCLAYSATFNSLRIPVHKHVPDVSEDSSFTEVYNQLVPYN
jgi:hypothetical protein